MLMNLIGFVIENSSYNWSIITYRNSNTNAVGIFHWIILVWLAVSIPVFVNVPVFVGGSIVSPTSLTSNSTYFVTSAAASQLSSIQLRREEGRRRMWWYCLICAIPFFCCSWSYLPFLCLRRTVNGTQFRPCLVTIAMASNRHHCPLIPLLGTTDVLRWLVYGPSTLLWRRSIHMYISWLEQSIHPPFL